MMKVESYITATSEIERYILALNTLAFRFVHMRYVEQISIHAIDSYLTQGGFTLVYGEYVAPRMAQVEESLRAYLKQCNGDTRRAFIAETAQRCECIGEAYRGLKRAQEPCYSQGEKIGGVTMRVSGYRYQILKCQMAEVSEGVLEIFPSFVELFNRLCVNYGCGAPLVYPLGRDGAKIEGVTTAQLPAELDNDDAKRLLDIAVEAGYLNSDYSRNPDKLNSTQSALLAEIIAGILNLTPKYSCFEELWGVNNMRQIRYNSRERVGTVRGGGNIEALYMKI